MSKHAIVATKVRDLKDGRYQGDARLYRLSQPVKYTRYESDDTGDATERTYTTEYVVVSAAVVMLTGPEVLIFPGDENGDVVDWLEVGGYRGGLSHETAILDNGWEIA